MDAAPPASAAAVAKGSVSSRFVSQAELTEAQKRREDAVRATYERLGQEVPPEALAAARGETEEYDPRTLYERLKANKDAKQEAIDEKLKLSNQFRGIDAAESEFLAEVAREKRLAERQKEQELKRELEEYRKASTKEGSPPVKVSATPVASTSTIVKPKGKRKREGLAGVVKKKREG